MNTLNKLEAELRQAEYALQKKSAPEAQAEVTLCAKQCVKEVLMDKRLEQEFFLAYETLLATLEECKASKLLAKFSIDVEKQLKEFEEEYPEVVSEYYLKHRP